ncbi:MAG TPA: FKBP-type peptidyl-prolyl cis-trans isomerase [Rhabdochlamydiaceae bacterium]|nr:FKBP-type peptidyl-prolyl cis-trans isomerase [Rhabdochlamydiaceae bacterium]
MNNKEKVSYCIGLEAGRSLRNQFSDMDLQFVIEGFQDAFSDAPLKLQDEEIRSVLTALSQQIASQQKQFLSKLAEENRTAGESFLSENKKKEGITTLTSGLQYKIMSSGRGASSPTILDVVTTHYRGMFIDGKEFDNSYVRGKPAAFPVNRVIAGWSEALQKMKIGDKWQLFVPSYLAYGEAGFGNQIGPNCTLVFEMELLGINDA